MHAAPGPLTADPGLLDALRADLAAAGFTVPGVEDLLGPLAAAALHREEPVPALLATGAPGAAADPRAALVRAFVLGVPVAADRLAAALPTLGVAGARRLGLVQTAGEGADDAVRALVDLRPYEAEDGAGTVDWWIASDLGELATGGALRTDHVLGVGGASTTLAQVTVREPRGRTLDLGTGCGIQALHASRHSGAVVGTDISARALAFARFNATLAGLAPPRSTCGSGRCWSRSPASGSTSWSATRRSSSPREPSATCRRTSTGTAAGPATRSCPS